MLGRVCIRLILSLKILSMCEARTSTVIQGGHREDTTSMYLCLVDAISYEYLSVSSLKSGSSFQYTFGHTR